MSCDAWRHASLFSLLPPQQDEAAIYGSQADQRNRASDSQMVLLLDREIDLDRTRGIHRGVRTAQQLT